MTSESESPLPRLAAYMTPQGAWRLFRALAAACPGSFLVWRLPWAFRQHPETDEVARRALATYLATARPWHWTRLLPRSLALRVLGWRYAGLRRMWERCPDAVGLCWNGFDRGRFLFAESARRAGRPCLFAELAPLPGFVTLDPQGVNFAGSVPSDPAFYAEWIRRHPDAADWRETGRHLTARPPRKAAAGAPAPRVDGPFILVPLQVPGDSQIRYFGDWIDAVESHIRAVLEASDHLPEGWTLVIKEHPSSRVPLGHLVDTARHPRCVLDNVTDTFGLVRRSRAVLTINSSVGLQSFFFDKPVIVLGKAFFGFEPMVARPRSQAALNALLASAETLGFDPVLRDRFMRYLVSAYYFPADLRARGLDDTQRARLAALLRGRRDA
jgi:capsular polysaccharide export protein